MYMYMYIKHVFYTVKPANVVTYIMDHLSYATALTGPFEPKYRVGWPLMRGLAVYLFVSIRDICTGRNESC